MYWNQFANIQLALVNQSALRRASRTNNGLSNNHSELVLTLPETTRNTTVLLSTLNTGNNFKLVIISNKINFLASNGNFASNKSNSDSNVQTGWHCKVACQHSLSITHSSFRRGTQRSAGPAVLVVLVALRPTKPKPILDYRENIRKASPPKRTATPGNFKP